MNQVHSFFTQLQTAFRNHRDRFAQNEQGMELIQVVIVIIISLVVAGVVWALVGGVNQKMEDAGEKVQEWDPTPNMPGK